VSNLYLFNLYYSYSMSNIHLQSYELLVNFFLCCQFDSIELVKKISVRFKIIIRLKFSKIHDCLMRVHIFRDLCLRGTTALSWMVFRSKFVIKILSYKVVIFYITIKHIMYYSCICKWKACSIRTLFNLLSWHYLFYLKDLYFW